MGLDMKHKNIGATVGLIKGMSALLPEDSTMPTEITELFMLEAQECDFQVKSEAENACVFNGSLAENKPCCIGECPLGELVSQEIALMDMSDIETKATSDYIGPCAGCGGDVTKNNLGHVDDHHQVCKSCFDQKSKH